jgi:hypothetical protein
MGRAADTAVELAGAIAGARSGDRAPTPQPEEAEREPSRRPAPPRPTRPRRPEPTARTTPTAPPPEPDEELRSTSHLAAAPGPRENPPAPAPSVSPAPPELPDEQTHISEEPELVLESAEPGAEDGAGASVTVLEPWEGYGRMAASQVIDRLEAATTEELAAVQLYEGAHRKRQTVLDAVHRRLRSAAGRASAE